VTVEGELYFDLFERDITGTEVIQVLERLLEEIRGRVIVVWDNGGIHRSVNVQTFVWLHR
jgi:transposase